MIPGLGRSPGGGHGNLVQYSCLENPHGLRSPLGCKESDMTERLSTAHSTRKNNLKKKKDKYICITELYAICMKLTRHCKSTIYVI